MLILLLLALLRLSTLFRGLSADESSITAVKPLVLQLDSCPDKASFFRREEIGSPVPGPCHLCICKDSASGTAECWPRDGWRCDVEFHPLQHKVTRIRRSPIGFGDIFFRDAARDMFNKRESEQCKPFGESYSEGCPPDDWCLGCTVCDCDANGHWDCHVLSFCDDNKDGKKGKIRKRYKGALRRGRKRRSTSTPRTEISTMKKTTIKSKNNKKSFKIIKKSIAPHKILKRTPKPNSKSSKPISKPNTKLKTTETLIVKKNVATKKPTTINNVKRKTVMKNRNKYDESKYGSDILKNVMKAVNMMFAQKIENETKVLLEQRMAKSPCPYTRKQKRHNVKKHSKIIAIKSNKPVNGNPTPTLVKKVVKRKAVSKNATRVPNKRKFVRNKRALFNSQLSDTNYTTTNHLGTVSDATDVYNSSTVVNNFISETNIPEKNYFTYTSNTSTQVYNDWFVTDRNESVLKVVKDKQLTKNSISDGVKAVGDIISRVTFNDTLNKFTVTHNDTLEVKEIESNLNQINNSLNNYNIKGNTNSTNNNGAYDDVGNLTASTVAYNNVLQLKTNRSDLKVILDNQIKQSVTIKKPTFRINFRYSPDTVLNSTNLNYSKWSQLKDLKDKGRRLWQDVIKNDTLLSEEVSNITNDYKIRHRLNITSLENLTNVFTNNIFVYKPKFKPEKNVTLKFRELDLKHNNNKSNNIKKNQTIVDRWLHKWFSRNNTNAATTIRPRMKNINILRYLRKFFRNVFSMGQRQKIKHLRKNSVLKILCKYFRRCKINSKNQAQLEMKIKQLNTEAHKILRIINIVKGLLRLLDFDENAENFIANNNKYANNSNPITDDIKKLNDILNGNYEKNFDLMSDAQIRQVEYIKNNTQEFIKSIGKFSAVLNEIIYITRIHSDLHDNEILDSNLVRLPRDYNELTTIDMPLSELKRLLLTYNLVQNNFLRRLYEALQDLRVETKYFKKQKVKSLKVRSRNLTQNHVESIETLTRTIIDNLRKLKNLAMNMNSSGRNKRTINMQDDSAVEYLLTLMEYLIRNHFTTEVKAVNDVHDGIDLLLEAIKNAPDIKHTQKKVLESLPMNSMSRISILSTTTPSTIKTADAPIDSFKEVFSDFHHMNSKNNLTLTTDSITKIPELSLDYEDVDDKRRIDTTREYSTNTNFTELNIESNIEPDYHNQTEIVYLEKETTIPVYYVTEDPESNDTYYAENNNKFAENNYIDSVFQKAFYLQLSTTEKVNNQLITDITTAETQLKEETEENFKSTTTERNDVIQDVNADGKKIKKYEVFVADIEDDDAQVATTAEPAKSVETSTNIIIPNTLTETVIQKFKPMKMRHYLPDLEDVSISDIQPKREKVNWIDEVYDHEFKEYAPSKSLNVPSRSTTETVTRTSKFIDHINNIRSINPKEASGNQKALPTAEDIMRKKQLDLLNSLDYGTEKVEIETETKHGNQDDWNSVDGFPTYFV